MADSMQLNLALVPLINLFNVLIFAQMLNINVFEIKAILLVLQLFFINKKSLALLFLHIVLLPI